MLTNEQLTWTAVPSPFRARRWQAPESEGLIDDLHRGRVHDPADRSDEWLALAEEFTQATRNESNLFFEWSHSVDNPHQFFLVEASSSDQAGEIHVNSEHFRTAMTWMPEVIAETHRPSTSRWNRTAGVGWVSCPRAEAGRP